MIWVRRFFAIVLAILFIPLLVGVLLLWRTNSTLRNPEFYVDELQKADVYAFAHDEVLPAAFDEAVKDTDLPFDVKPLKDEILSGAREILPPEWLQEQSENAIREVVPYVVGDTDSFSVTVPLQDRVEAVAGVLKKNVRQGDVFPTFYGAAVDFVAEQAASSGTLELPMGIRLSQLEVEGYVQRVVPQDWVRARMEQSIDNMTPFIVGKSDTFQVTVPLADRADAAGGILKEVLAKADTQGFVVDQMVMPFIEKNVGDSMDIVFGAKLTRAEVVDAVQKVLTRQWLTSLQDQTVDQLVAYLTGKSQTFAVTVPLEERKQAAIQALGSLVDQRLEAQFQALPSCTLGQLASLNLQANTLPPCRPAGVTYAGVKQALNIDLGAEIARVVGSQVPDRWTFTEADLRTALGTNGVETLDRARTWVQTGVTFTEADLRKQLDADAEKTLDDARTRIREGFTFTDADLRELIAESGGAADFDNVRNYLGMLSWIPLVGTALLTLLLALIGLLGGRNWGSRLAWGAAVLGVVSLAILAAIVVGYSIARPMIETALADVVAEAGEAGALATLMAERMTVLALNVADGFVGGLRFQAIVLVGLAVAALAGGIYLQASYRRARGAAPTPPAPREATAAR